ncbi:MAG: hypothetical protein ACR2PI_03030 [Hyphomicrobiaceae bacterium]
MVQVSPAAAHSSNQAFVLLLPTGFYVTSGVLAVVITIGLLAIPRLGRHLHRLPSARLFRAPSLDLATSVSLGSLALLVFLVSVGFWGARDPLTNPLPLFIWTVWWVGFVVVQALLGDLWRWVNPWSGLHRLVSGVSTEQPPFRLPDALGYWPGVAGFALFNFFMLAHPSPDDPAELAVVVAIYWSVTLVGMLLFGADAWLNRCECFTMLLRWFAKNSVFGTRDGQLRLGLPGWKYDKDAGPSVSGALFVVFVLGASSFDGLNETFWWLVFLDVNPLEYPGRSALIWQTIGGAIALNILLVIVFSICVFAGLCFTGGTTRFNEAFCRYAPTILPIAIGYHVAHFLPAFLVNIQYAVAAASDPWSTGADYLGLGTFYVTTGFFNSLDTVRIIYLTQVVAVVAGHVLSLLAAHGVAADLFRDDRRALVSQIPLALFMIAYTFFGLWLLAAPRGA